MRRALPGLAALAAGTVAGYLLWVGTTGRVYTSHFDNVMGTSLEIKLQARSAAAARAAESQVLTEIGRLSKILSGYDPESEFSQWMRSSAVPVRVSPELIEVLSAFEEWGARTSAALEPAAEALSQVWKHAASENRLPAKGELD